MRYPKEILLIIALFFTFFQSTMLPGQSSNECVMCQCKNIEVIPADPSATKWVFSTWITMIATLSSLGFVTSMALSLFFICKTSCTNEVLESSQATSLLLLFGKFKNYIYMFLIFPPTKYFCHSLTYFYSTYIQNNLFWMMHPTTQLAALSKRDAPAYIYFPPRYYVYLC